MSDARIAARLPGADAGLAALCSLAIGCGLVIAAAAAALGQPIVAAAGGAAAGAGLVMLIAAGWLDGLLVAALAVPLPALISDGDLRVAAAAPVTAAVIAGWLLAFESAPGRATPRIHGATLWLLGAFAVATVFASSVAVSARELLNVTVLFAFFLLAMRHAREPSAGRVVTMLSVLAAVCGGLAVLEMVGVLPGAFPRWGTPFNRAALGFGQPNGLGLFLAVSLPLTVHAVRVGRGLERAVAACVLLAVAAGLFATFSRGSWLSVLGGAAALVFVRDARFLVRFLFGALILAAVLDAASGGMIRDTAQRTLTDWVVEQRAALMFTGLLMFLANPVFGVGPGGFAVQLEAYGARVPELWDYLPTPHNAYVQMAAETGLIGLVAFLVFLALCFRALVRRANDAADAGASPREISLRRCLLWSFATACCACLFVWPFAHGTGQAVLLLLALGLARDTP